MRCAKMFTKHVVMSVVGSSLQNSALFYVVLSDGQKVTFMKYCCLCKPQFVKRSEAFFWRHL